MTIEIQKNQQMVEVNPVPDLLQQPEISRVAIAPDKPAENPYINELDNGNQDRSLMRDALIINNSVGSILNSFDKNNNIDYAVQEGYVPRQDDAALYNGIALEDYPYLDNSRSPAELRMKLRKMHDEDMARENIQRNGAVGLLAEVFSGAADPINLIPIVGQSTKAKMAWGAATAATDEAILQANQEHRTGMESAINIGSSTVMTGLISTLAKKYDVKVDNILNEGIKDPHEQIDFISVKDGGAAATPDNLLINDFTEDETKLVGASVAKVAGFGPMSGIGFKLMTSSNSTTRNIANDLFDHGFVTVGHTKGKAVDNLYSRIEVEKNRWAGAINQADEQGYSEFVESTKGRNIANSKEDFYKLVNRELRYSDVADTLATDVGIQGVKKLSDAIGKMYDDLGKVLYEYGKITNPDNVYGAVNFAPRDYRKDFMRLNATKVQDELAAKIEAKWKADPKELELAMDKSEGSFSNIKQEALDTAKSIYQSIIDGKSEFPSTSGRRKLRLEDKDLLSLIEGNPLETAYRYAAKTLPKVEMLKRYGHYDVEKFTKEISDKYLDDVRKLDEQGKKSSHLRKQYNNDIENFKVGFNRLMGNPSEYSKNTNAYQETLQFTNNLLTMQLMGKAVFSALGDLGGNVMINGPIRSMSAYGKALLDFSDVGKLSKTQAKQMANAWELAVNQRSLDMEEIFNESTHPVNELMGRVSTTFMKATGLPKWTEFGQGVGSLISVDKIISHAETLAQGGKLKQSEITFLAQHGLTSRDLADILETSQKYGDVKNRILNVDKWGDRELAAKFQSSVIRMRDTGVVTVNPATLPAFMDKPEMKLLFKFQSFAWAAWQRIAIAGLQRHDANFLFGSTAMIGLGVVNVKLRSELFGNKEPDSWDGWITQGVQSSGLGLFPVQMYDKLGGLGGLPPSSRMLENAKTYGYQEGKPDLLRAVGPVGQDFKNVSTMINGLMPGERWDQEEIDATRRMAPFNNLWYASSAVDQFNRGWASAIGVPYKTKDNLINNFIENK